MFVVVTATETAEPYVIMPCVMRPGSGGCWQHVRATPESLAANGMEPLVMAGLDNYTRGALEVEPSFDDGNTDRWAIPSAASA